MMLDNKNHQKWPLKVIKRQQERVTNFFCSAPLRVRAGSQAVFLKFFHSGQNIPPRSASILAEGAPGGTDSAAGCASGAVNAGGSAPPAEAAGEKANGRRNT